MDPSNLLKNCSTLAHVFCFHGSWVCMLPLMFSMSLFGSLLTCSMGRIICPLLNLWLCVILCLLIAALVDVCDLELVFMVIVRCGCLFLCYLQKNLCYLQSQKDTYIKVTLYFLPHMIRMIMICGFFPLLLACCRVQIEDWPWPLSMQPLMSQIQSHRKGWLWIVMLYCCLFMSVNVYQCIWAEQHSYCLGLLGKMVVDVSRLMLVCCMYHSFVPLFSKIDSSSVQLFIKIGQMWMKSMNLEQKIKAI